MLSNSADIKISDNIKYLYKMDKYLEKNLTKTHQMFNSSKLGK